MSVELSFAFPLHIVVDTDLQNLGRELWNWQLCGKCNGSASCANMHCPWSRGKRLGRFWTWYKGITGMYVPELFCLNPALRSHSDLLGIIRLMKTHPDAPRVHLTQQYFANRDDAAIKIPDPTDQLRAFNIAARVLLMVNCGLSHESIEILEYAQLPRPWRNDMSISQFVIEIFPTSNHPYFEDLSELSDNLAIRKAVAASSLKKRANLRLEPTDDLRNHLRLDRKQGTVQIFHQTAVLKESLIAGHALHPASTISDYICRYVC
jgi:hypothetical protein